MHPLAKNRSFAHDGDNKIWRISKALRNTCKYSPPLRNDETFHASPAEKANLLATTFEKSHNNQMDDDPDTVAAVERSIQEVDNTEPPPDNEWLVSPREVDKIICNLKTKKHLALTESEIVY